LATEITRESIAPRRRRALRRGGWAARAIAAGLGLWLVAGPAAADDLSPAEIEELEGLLAVLGFDPGPVDGIADDRTATAIRSYQSFAALRVDGVASPALLEELRGVSASLENVEHNAPAEAAAAEPEAAEPEAADAGPAKVADTTVPDDQDNRASQAGEPDIAAPAAHGRSTGPAVHLASFRHKEKAEEEWQRLQHMLPNLLRDMVPSIEAVDLGDEGLFFRLYARPFPNQATAEDFCQMIVQEGYNCRVVSAGERQAADREPASEDPPKAEDPLATEDAPAAKDPPAPEEAPEAKALPEPEDAPAESTQGGAGLAATDGTAAPAESTQGGTDLPPPTTATIATAPTGPTATTPAPKAGVDAPTALVAGGQVGRVGMEAGAGGGAGGDAGPPTVLIVAARFLDAARGSVPYADPARPSEIGALTDDSNFAAPPTPTDAPEEETRAAALGDGGGAYATATAAFRSGDCATALRYYTQAFAGGGLSRQDLAVGHNNRGRCLYDRARYDEALADFDQAIAYDERFAAAYYNRGRAHNALGDRGQARADLDKAYDLGFDRLDPEP
jgi:peptidoglycan hydrolase-like protein with peptidoglycan-binding domain